MSTLHEAVSRKLEEFDAMARRAKTAEEARHVEDMRAAFLLDSVPFIKEYHDADAGETKAEILEGVARVTKRTNKHNVLQKFKFYVEADNTPEAVNEALREESERYSCECGGQRICDYTRWDAICETCGKVTRMGFDVGPGCLGDNVSLVSHAHREGLAQINHLAYKRINHFNDWLNKLQGKEGTEVPDEVKEAVRAELKKYRVTSSHDITPDRVRQYLKKLRLDKYYDNVYSIAHALGGPPPKRFPQDLENRLKEMFVQVQTPWEQTKPAKRKNFLSYAYCLHKFCELLGADEYLESLSLLKSAEKLHAQDEMWKGVCDVLKWEFIPSAS